MTEPLKIDVDDDHLWRTTLEAVAATQERKRPRITIRCAGECGAALGGLDVMPQGPLMISWWEFPAKPEVVLVNGVKVPRDEWERRNNLRVKEWGPPPGDTETMSVIALIGSGLPEYPALLVRCATHGDLVLDRTEALDRLRQVKVGGHDIWAVTPTLPFSDYLSPRDLDHWPGRDRKYRRSTEL